MMNFLVGFFLWCVRAASWAGNVPAGPNAPVCRWTAGGRPGEERYVGETRSRREGGLGEWYGDVIAKGLLAPC